MDKPDTKSLRDLADSVSGAPLYEQRMGDQIREAAEWIDNHSCGMLAGSIHTERFYGQPVRKTKGLPGVHTVLRGGWESWIPKEETATPSTPTPKLPEGRGCVRNPSDLFDAHQDVEEPMTLGEAKALGHLVDHGHEAGDCCDEPDCYQAWEMYPDG